jgi:hypothetical protein
MAVATGPRILFEVGFLVVLAVVLAFSDLGIAPIILVMGLAWVLASLIEYFAWRQGPRIPRRFAAAPASVLMHEDEPAGSEPERPSSPPPPEEQTAAEPPPDEPEPDAQEPVQSSEFEVEERARHHLAPLQPRPRRRWIFFGPRQRRAEEPGSREEES